VHWIEGPKPIVGGCVARWWVAPKDIEGVAVPRWKRRKEETSGCKLIELGEHLLCFVDIINLESRGRSKQ
jgi:hypothetical protein